MSEYRKIVYRPGELLDHECVFEDNQFLRTAVPSKKGKVERLDYTTSVYEDGKTYTKTAYVYLPYGYDAENRDRKYNVLYFQHGNTCEPAMFAIGGNKPMFDMLFESGENDPCIIVFITYYFDPLRDSVDRVRDGSAPAGDGWTPGIPGNYWKEIVDDIIPAVELKYNTYLTDGSKEGIKATRDHRAFAGYSRGTMTTFRTFHYDFEYFRWWLPTSGTVVCDYALTFPPRPGSQPKITDEEIIDYITAPIKAHPDLPFYMFASNGGERDVRDMTRQIKMFSELDCFSYGLDPKVNNLYYSRSDFYHTDYLIPYYLWNGLKVVFKGI